VRGLPTPDETGLAPLRHASRTAPIRRDGRLDGADRRLQTEERRKHFIAPGSLETDREREAAMTTLRSSDDGVLRCSQTRDRVLGHAGDVSRRYGRKGILDSAVAGFIEALEPPVIKTAHEILLGAKSKADCGELTVLKTYSTHG
jgi:hypothetical protein